MRPWRHDVYSSIVEHTRYGYAIQIACDSKLTCKVLTTVAIRNTRNNCLILTVVVENKLSSTSIK